MRIKFRRRKQREFLRIIVENTGAPSVRALSQFGLETDYTTMKSYFQEHRTLPSELFYTLCRVGGVKESDFKFKLLEDNWGQMKGGKKGKRGRKSGRTKK